MGFHFLLQSMKVKSESEVAQSCLTLCDSMDCSLPGSSVHGIFQARVLEHHRCLVKVWSDHLWASIDLRHQSLQTCLLILSLKKKKTSPFWASIKIKNFHISIHNRVSKNPKIRRHWSLFPNNMGQSYGSSLLITPPVYTRGCLLLSPDPSHPVSKVHVTCLDPGDHGVPPWEDSPSGNSPRQTRSFFFLLRAVYQPWWLRW